MTDSRKQDTLREFIAILSTHKPYTDVFILDELIHVSRKRYGVPYRLALGFIEANVLPYIYLVGLGEDEYRYASEILLKHGLKPSDALHVGAMPSNGANVVVSED